MVRLTRLKIERFRNVVPGTDLRFGPTFNCLLGKNATGKSTLLDLIAAVTNDDFSAYAGEDAGFDLTWWLEEDGAELELSASRTPSRPGAWFNQGREEKEFDDSWKIVLRTGGVVSLQITVDGTTGTWKTPTDPERRFDVKAGLADGRALARSLVSSLPPEITVLSAAHWSPRAFAAHWISQTFALAGVGRFDEAIDALSKITSSSLELQSELREDRNHFKGGSYGAWLPDEWSLALPNLDTFDPPVIPLDAISSFAEIPPAIGFARAEMIPRVFRRSKDGASVTTTYHGIDFLFQRSDGSEVSHELLSFGQKRLFGFLWYLAARRGFPVVADELLNGLHHEWIELCFERLRERQSFLATQHPFLLDHIPIESAEAVRTTFIRCSVEHGGGGYETLVWRNFNEEEAERFYIAYQTGIQQVSEVLRSEGLW